MACGGRSTLEGAPLEGFDESQRAYLSTLLSELDLAAVYKGPAPVGDAAALTVHGTPLEDLSTPERLKLEEHPDEMWPKLRRHAREARMPEGGDIFMFKHHGLFNVAPAQPGFMCRLRIPACRLRADQLAGLADLAEAYAGGYSHVTTRGNLQIREIPPEHIIDVLEGLYDLGLTSKGSGADSVRNITCNPTAGFDPHELMDLSPYAVRLHHHILNTPSLHGIPRKFNIAFDGGGTISAVADTNDIGFVAYRLTDEYLTAHPDVAERVDEGIVCRILLGGITGHGDFAISSGFACLPEQMPDIADAMLRVFIEHGDRTNRKRARLKYLLDDWGHERFTLTAAERLDFNLLRLDAGDTLPRHEVDRQAHIGIHPQRQEGLRYLGVALPIGLIPAHPMRGLATIARRYGTGDLRLTVWQNLIIPHIAEGDIEEATAAVRGLGLDVDASSFASGIVACTGRFGCQYASAHTKEHAAMLVERLQRRFTLDRPINIHLTGCVNSCAQHYIGDIGLLGGSTDDGREAYGVYLGGGCEHERGLARFLAGPIVADEIEPFLAGVIGTYLDARRGDESFLEFTRRLGDDELAGAFLNEDDPERSEDRPLTKRTSGVEAGYAGGDALSDVANADADAPTEPFVLETV